MLFGLMIVFALLDVVGAATIVSDGDALRYHLATPHYWLQIGAIEHTSGILFRSFPMLVQISYGHALAWGYLAVPALLHVGWALMLTAGVYVWTRRSWNAAVALLAALLLLSLT